MLVEEDGQQCVDDLGFKDLREDVCENSRVDSTQLDRTEPSSIHTSTVQQLPNIHAFVGSPLQHKNQHLPQPFHQHQHHFSRKHLNDPIVFAQQQEQPPVLNNQQTFYTNNSFCFPGNNFSGSLHYEEFEKGFHSNSRPNLNQNSTYFRNFSSLPPVHGTLVHA